MFKFSASWVKQGCNLLSLLVHCTTWRSFVDRFQSWCLASTWSHNIDLSSITPLTFLPQFLKLTLVTILILTWKSKTWELRMLWFDICCLSVMLETRASYTIECTFFLLYLLGNACYCEILWNISDEGFCNLSCLLYCILTINIIIIVAF